MKKWEDLYIKVQEAEAINSNINHLVNVLEHDNFWIDRHKLTGTARNQIEAFEMKLNEMKNLLIESEKGHEAFHDAYNKVKSPYHLSNMSEKEEEESYHMMSDGVNSSIDGSVKLRDGLIQVINSFREAQNLPPLDGGLSSLN